MIDILVVVDMQKDFIDGSLGTKEAVGIVPKVIETIACYQKKGARIYFTMDTHSTNYLETQEGKKLPVVHCVKDTEGWQLAEGVRTLAQEINVLQGGETIFEKGVFGSKELAVSIQQCVPVGEEVRILLVGLCTDICVLANAMLLKTLLPEASIVVDANACAGVSPKSHANALAAMAMCQIEIVEEKGE